MSPAQMTTGFRSRMKPAFPRGRGREHAGFTMLELVSVIVVIGILAAVLIPRFSGRITFDTRGYADHVRGALQYAQKVAIAERRNVCATVVAGSGGSVSLRKSDSAGAGRSCSDGTSIALLDPTTGAAFSIVAPSGVTVGASVSPVIFDALGQSVTAAGVPQAQVTVTITGDFTATITVERETGNVH